MYANYQQKAIVNIVNFQVTFFQINFQFTFTNIKHFNSNKRTVHKISGGSIITPKNIYDHTGCDRMDSTDRLPNPTAEYFS